MLSDRASHNFTQPLVTFYIGHIFYVFHYSSQKMMHISLFPAIKREGAIKTWTDIVMIHSFIKCPNLSIIIVLRIKWSFGTKYFLMN